ncbi:MAG: MFS transporter [Halobacteria archaeon]|nr:MFS transporter [Halobacteria archaeon]
MRALRFPISFVKQFQGFDRPVYAIFVARFINVLGSGVVYPFAALYFYDEVGIPFTLVGIGLFANSVATGVGTGVGGYLADRYGRKPVMVASMALSAVTLSAYALVTTAPSFIAVASGAGFTMGLYSPASQAMIADLTAQEDRERAYALLKVASNAGFGSGFAAGGVLYSVTKTTIFVVDGVTSGVVAVVLLAILPRVRGKTRISTSIGDWGHAVTRPRILGLAVLNVGFAVAYAQMGSTVPVFASETLGLESQQLGALYVLNPLVIVLFQMPFVSWVESWRRTRGLVLSTGFWGASFVAIILAHYTSVAIGIALVGFFLVLRTVGEILHSPLITALTSDIAETQTRGTQLSTLEIAKRLGFGIGPVIGGLFFDYGVEPLLWPTLVGMCALLAVGVLVLETGVSPEENGVAPLPAD